MHGVMMQHVPAFLIILFAPVLGLAQEETDTVQAARVTHGAMRFWTIETITERSLRTLPMRRTNHYAAMIPGVTEIGGEVLFRGGSPEDVGYVFEGVPATNPFFNSPIAPVIPQSLESLEIHSGAFGTEYGGTSGGLIVSRLKTGAEGFAWGLDARTDEIAPPGGSLTVHGYKNVVATIGTTFPGGFSAFVAGDYSFMRNRQPMFLEPFRFENLVTDGLNGPPAGEPLPGPVDFKRNFLYNNWQESLTLQGKATWESGEGTRASVFGSYWTETMPIGGSWPVALQNVYRQNRNMESYQRSMFGGTTITHSLSDQIRIRASISLSRISQRLFDPDFGTNWRSYVDSVENARRGFPEFLGRYYPQPSYSTVFAFLLYHPSLPNNTYTRSRQESVRIAGGATLPVIDGWELDADVSLDDWTLRKFHVQDIRGLRTFLDTNQDGTDDRTFATEEERWFLSAQTGKINTYGYIDTGAETEIGPDAPRVFKTTVVSLNNRFALGSFNGMIGARYEVHTLSSLASSKVEPGVDYVLPRMSVSYAFSPELLAWFSGGKYVQYRPLDEEFIGAGLLVFQNPYGEWPPISPFTLVIPIKPERTTHIEGGIRTSLIPFIHLSLTGYMKFTSNEWFQLSRIIAGYTDSRVNGIELTAVADRFFGFRPEIRYSLSGSSIKVPRSDPRTNSFLAGEYLGKESDQQHRIRFLVDYSDGGGSGEELFGAVLFCKISSGFPYTPIQSANNLGSATAWNIGVQGITDSRSRLPTGPSNSASTPWSWTLDLQLRASLNVAGLPLSVYAVVMNVLNTRNVIHVYPQSGNAEDDTWLDSPYADPYKALPNYEAFYRTINLENHWAYSTYVGGDMVGSPRQFWLGVSVGS